ncbi:MAG: glycosyltransferase family 39 protein [Ruminococcus flavefaciens]|nr:glycosyltransferase family 39 protein [Ruminococcus flavefaciens]
MLKKERYLSIISGIFFGAVMLLSGYSLIPVVSRECGHKGVGVLLVIALMIFSYMLSMATDRLEKLSGKLICGDSKKADRIFCAVALMLFAVQVIFAFGRDFTPKNDLSYVCQGAENLVTGKPLYNDIPDIHSHYFAVYPNNHMLFTVIYGLYKLEYIITGNITNTLPVILNIISLNISYVLMYCTARVMYSPERSLVCAVRGLMFTPIITYSAFFYTDSMAMPWITGALYLYVKWCRNGKLLHMALCGTVLAFAYKLKGSAGIFIPAVIVDMILSRRKKGVRGLAVLVVVFAVCCAVLGEISGRVAGVDSTELERYRFPLIHWVMMSADGRGGYCAEDFKYTLSFNGYDSKVNADICRLAEKMSAEGVSGFCGHLFQKISYTWRDCTYMAGYYNKYDFLRSYGFYTFTAVCHFTLMSGIVRRSIFEKKSTDFSLMLKVMLTGLAVFLMIWEARCRYLVSFFVLFALI